MCTPVVPEYPLTLQHSSYLSSEQTMIHAIEPAFVSICAPKQHTALADRGGAEIIFAIIYGISYAKAERDDN